MARFGQRRLPSSGDEGREAERRQNRRRPLPNDHRTPRAEAVAHAFNRLDLRDEAVLPDRNRPRDRQPPLLPATARRASVVGPDNPRVSDSSIASFMTDITRATPSTSGSGSSTRAQPPNWDSPTNSLYGAQQLVIVPHNGLGTGSHPSDPDVMDLVNLASRTDPASPDHRYERYGNNNTNDRRDRPVTYEAIYRYAQRRDSIDLDEPREMVSQGEHRHAPNIGVRQNSGTGSERPPPQAHRYVREDEPNRRASQQGQRSMAAVERSSHNHRPHIQGSGQDSQYQYRLNRDGESTWHHTGYHAPRSSATRQHRDLDGHPGITPAGLYSSHDPPRDQSTQSSRVRHGPEDLGAAGPHQPRRDVTGNEGRERDRQIIGHGFRESYDLPAIPVSQDQIRRTQSQWYDNDAHHERRHNSGRHSRALPHGNHEGLGRSNLS